MTEADPDWASTGGITPVSWNCASRQGWEVLRGYICVCNHIHTPFIILPTNLTLVWLQVLGSFLQHLISLSWARLSDFTFTFHFHALEKEMATHSSTLAWRIPGTEEPSGLLSMESHRVGHD